MEENKPLTSIRGIAALYIVAEHIDLFYFNRGGFLSWLMQSGHVAVDVFFVLSGFILTAIYWNLGQTQSVRTFLFRRVIRLYPLHFFIMFSLAAAKIASSVLHLNINAQLNWHNFLPVLALIQPFIADKFMGWNAASWSIGIEMMCYLILPFWLMALRKIKYPVFLCMFFIGLEIIAVHFFGGDHAGFGSIARGLAGFGLGTALYAFNRDKSGLSAWMHSYIEVATLAGAIVCIMAEKADFISPLCGILIASMYFNRGKIAKTLESPLLHWLGKISFSIYLTQFPILIALGKFVSPDKIPLPRSLVDLLFIIASTAIILGVSNFTWRYVEEPARKWGHKKTAFRQISTT